MEQRVAELESQLRDAQAQVRHCIDGVLCILTTAQTKRADLTERVTLSMIPGFHRRMQRPSTPSMPAR